MRHPFVGAVRLQSFIAAASYWEHLCALKSAACSFHLTTAPGNDWRLQKENGFTQTSLKPVCTEIHVRTCYLALGGASVYLHTASTGTRCPPSVCSRVIHVPPPVRVQDSSCIQHLPRSLTTDASQSYESQATALPNAQTHMLPASGHGAARHP
jgi:hypothetical protein